LTKIFTVQRTRWRASKRPGINKYQLRTRLLQQINIDLISQVHFIVVYNYYLY